MQCYGSPNPNGAFRNETFTLHFYVVYNRFLRLFKKRSCTDMFTQFTKFQ